MSKGMKNRHIKIKLDRYGVPHLFVDGVERKGLTTKEKEVFRESLDELRATGYYDLLQQVFKL